MPIQNYPTVFDCTEMTAAVNKLPARPFFFKPLFEVKGVKTTTVSLDIRKGRIVLIGDSERNTAPESLAGRGAKREWKHLSCAHLAQMDTLAPEDLQDVRAFGSTEPISVAAVYNDKMQQLKDNLAATMEFHRLGAIKGVVLDADGTTVLHDIFNTFGATKKTLDISFPKTAADDANPILTSILKAKRHVEAAMGGTPFDHIECIIGSDAYDMLTSHKLVREYFERWLSNRENFGNNDYRKRGFPYGGLTFVERSDVVGGQTMVAAKKGHVYPVGPGIFKQYHAPADWMETVNTIGLERLGFTADTKVPGGEIVLDGNGLPTGLLLENAIIEASGRLPVPTEAQVRESLVRAIAEYNKKGFTTFQDGGLGINGEAEVFLRPYMELAREGRLNARAYLQLLPSEMDKLISLGVWGIGNDHMKIGGVKYFTDGSIQGFTGALLEDYYTRPGYKGALLWSQEEIDEIIIKYHCLGFQVAVHTNGDAASESVIQAFEKAVERCPRTDLRHMLIHAQLVSDSQLERMKACGIIPSLFARHIEVWGDRHAAIFLGPERTARMDPAGSCVRLGMPFSLHVDTPVLPVTALGSMHAAVNRISDGGVLFGGDQRITPRQALEAYTTYASLCCGGEHDRGRIEPGRFADFVLLDSDIEAIDPSGIRDIKVLKTICGGRVVYEA